MYFFSLFETRYLSILILAYDSFVNVIQIQQLRNRINASNPYSGRAPRTARHLVARSGALVETAKCVAIATKPPAIQSYSLAREETWLLKLSRRTLLTP